MALISIIENHLSVHIRKAISRSHMTYAENRSQLVPIGFKSGTSYVKPTIGAIVKLSVLLYL